MPRPLRHRNREISIIEVRSDRERQLFPTHATTIRRLFAAPGPNGLIALSTVDVVDGSPHEVITLVDRHGERRTTFDVEGSGECSLWSPDGSMITYCHHDGGFFSTDGRFAVWLMNADGTERRGMARASPSRSRRQPNGHL